MTHGNPAATLVWASACPRGSPAARLAERRSVSPVNLRIGCSVGGESGGGLNTQRVVLTEQISAQSAGQMLR